MNSAALPKWLGWVALPFGVIAVKPLGWITLIFALPLWTVIVSVLIVARPSAQTRAPAPATG